MTIRPPFVSLNDMSTEETEIRRNRSGLFIVIALAVVFFVLLALIIHGVKKSTNEKPDTRVVYVIPAKLRVRTDPTAKAAVADNVFQSERLLMLEAQGAWAKVQTPKNIIGWAERSALEDEEERGRRLSRLKSIRSLPPLEGEVLSQSALYAGPGLFYSVIGQLQPRSKVKVFTRDHDFFAIEHGGEIAYAEVDSIDLSASGGDAQLEVAATQPPPTATSSAEPPATESVAEDQTSTEPPPTNPTEDHPAADGVYPVVPPGGTEPRVISRSLPTYPSAARSSGTEGTVILRTIVEKDGRVSDIEVVKDLPFGLGDAAADAVRRWRFAPATLNGQPISVYYTVTVNFKLSG